MNKDLIDRLNAEAESCAEEGLDDIAALLDEARAAIEAQSVPAGYVRFCPECGTTGEVRPTARDCCPDGSHAAYMPAKTSEVCSETFHALLAAAPQPDQTATPMTAQRAAFFMERFKKEEKLLGPNEQAAINFVIVMLTTQQAQPAQPLSDEQIAEMCGDANRGYDIDFDDYRKAVKDTEAAHNITEGTK